MAEQVAGEREDGGDAKRRRPRLNLSTVILIGLATGLATGLFFGESCARLKILGDAYIALIQMTVLPYITFALISSIGGLTMQTARLLAMKGLIVMGGLWAIGLLIVVLIPLSFPEFQTASFFSTNMVETPTQVDYLRLYIPSNPFASLANSFVPAVVLFSLATGVALISVRNKERLIDPLRVTVEALGRINLAIVRLTPIGVFGMAAAAAGTLTLAELGRLQAYLIGYVVATLMLSVWILPMLVASLTPFRYRQIVRLGRDAAVTAFATDNVFIVLPLLAHSAQRLFAQRQEESAEPPAEIDVLVPVSYTFPNLGKVLALVFVPFAAWFVGRPLPLDEYIPFAVTGLGTLFAQTSVAMPFLLDFMHLPTDMFQLYLLAGLICGRFGALVASVYLFAFTVLTTSLMRGEIQVRRKALLGLLGVSVVALAIMAVGTRAYLRYSMQGQYQKDKVLARMQLLDDPVTYTLLDSAVPNPDPLEQGESRLQRIRRRGTLRVGVQTDALPFSFINGRGQLVGLDIELMHALAADMNVVLEFVPMMRTRVTEHLAADHADIAVSGLAMSLSYFEELLLVGPYLELTPALVVRDYRRSEFKTFEKVRRTKGLRIGMVPDPYLMQRVSTWMPWAEIVPIESHREFFEGEEGTMDAVVGSAEAGSAWTLLYPDFTVVLSATEQVLKWPVCIPVAGRDRPLADFLENWLEIKSRDGTIDDAFDYWILGRAAEDDGPRWCIARDVLGWIN